MTQVRRKKKGMIQDNLKKIPTRRANEAQTVGYVYQ